MEKDRQPSNIVPTGNEPEIKDENVDVKVKKEEPEDDASTPNFPDAIWIDDTFDDVDNESTAENDDEDELVDHTYEGICLINGIEHFVCETFKIRQIPTPLVVLRSLGDLYGALEYGSIVLNPDYQRAVVWDEDRAATLINSMLMGYFIPPVIFNHKMVTEDTSEGRTQKKKRICVDGKQRLSSLQKFMNGQIGIYDGSRQAKKWFFCHPKVDGIETESSHEIMPKVVKDFFLTKTLCCYEYDEMPEDIEENMFQLVQRGIALTPAEKMRALSTPWATFAKQYEDDYSMVVNLSKQLRGSAFRMVLTIFSMLLEVVISKRMRNSDPGLQASPKILARLLENTEPISSSIKLRFKAIFDRIEGLVKLCSHQITATKYRIKTNSVFDPAPNFLREDAVNNPRTFSPVELMGTAILVAYFMDSRTGDQLLHDIKELRYYLRFNHRDLRINASCWQSTWKFIKRIEAKQARNSKSASREANDDEDELSEGTRALQARRLRKRKTAVRRRPRPAERTQDRVVDLLDDTSSMSSFETDSDASSQDTPEEEEDEKEEEERPSGRNVGRSKTKQQLSSNLRAGNASKRAGRLNTRRSKRPLVESSSEDDFDTEPMFPNLTKRQRQETSEPVD